jgi:hypothetical protein
VRKSTRRSREAGSGKNAGLYHEAGGVTNVMIEQKGIGI